MVVVVQRLAHAAPSGSVTLAAGNWTDVLTGYRYETSVPAVDLLATLPVALLVREP